MFFEICLKRGRCTLVNLCRANSLQEAIEQLNVFYQQGYKFESYRRSTEMTDLLRF